MTRERILVTVKTYPTLSEDYGELVCTAGIREDGSWVRLYPVPFRRLDEDQQYRKFDWVECDLERNTSDPRPESFRPVHGAEIRRTEHTGTNDHWAERRRLVIKPGTVMRSMADLIRRAHANESSLATFKPARLLEFEIERDDDSTLAEKTAKRRRKIQEIKDKLLVPDMFGEDEWRRTFEVLPELPYKFRYRFEDISGKESRLRILDWEIGALYWKCRRAARNDEEALAKVRRRYWDEFTKRDLHFFLGTSQQWHSSAPNPWMIIGVFPIPTDPRLELFV